MDRVGRGRRGGTRVLTRPKRSRSYWREDEDSSKEEEEEEGEEQEQEQDPNKKVEEQEQGSLNGNVVGDKNNNNKDCWRQQRRGANVKEGSDSHHGIANHHAKMEEMEEN